MCRLSFQAQISVPKEHTDLSLYKHCSFIAWQSVNIVYSCDSLKGFFPMALKIVYQICYAIDVHKTFVFACIASTNSKGITTYKLHRFSAYIKELKEQLQWLCENNCKDVCMEYPEKYWIPVFNILEDSCKITLVRPKYVKAIRGKKTDKKDAKWIADFFSMTL